MRIISGRLRGRTLLLPRGATARPTPDRAREALFSILGDVVPGRTVLDLFAGSGALGFEALSRGAKSVLFVEKDPAVARAVESAAKTFHLEPDEVEVMISTASRFLTRVSGTGRQFGLIFADPPWGSAELLASALEARSLMAPDGVFVLEFEWIRWVQRFESDGQNWDLRRYGQLGFAIFRA